MGWTSYHATHYKGGTVDRKAECDAYFMESLNAGHYKVLKSTMKGSVYYAAVKNLTKYVGNNQYETLPEGEQNVFGVVFLTSVDMRDYYNFSYKDMDETCGPFCYDCPESILKLLSPTDSEYALKWRSKCREHAKKRAFLKKSPIGTVVEFVLNGHTVRFLKHSPAYQFKNPFWFNPERNSYISESGIPDSFKVIGEESEM